MLINVPKILVKQLKIKGKDKFYINKNTFIPFKK